jgi:putative DNA primase/helicase
MHDSLGKRRNGKHPGNTKSFSSQRKAKAIAKSKKPKSVSLKKLRLLTDVGNAKTLVDLHGQDIRYCYSSAKWLVWDGKRWVEDSTGEIHRRAKDTAIKVLEAATKVKDDYDRRRLAMHALRAQSDARIKAMISQAKSEPGIAANINNFDADPWLLNVANGTLDLRSGKLRPHKREDLLTKITPVSYDPKAICPTWDIFLDRIMGGNEELIRFLQKAVGYSLTGRANEQVIFIFHGAGANGKSTFIKVILSLLGDYALQTPTETLLIKKGGGVPNDVARLKGARFVAAVEAEAGKQLAEVLVKQLTGEDKITARFLYQEFFEFDPTFKLFLAANHKPTIKNNDHAIWRRIRLVPFTVTIPSKEQDKDLGEKLKTELPGILCWAVKGCLVWQREGLEIPESVTAAINEYRSEMDAIGDFIAECCEVTPDAKTPFNQLYRRYMNWCLENAESWSSAKEFAQNLADRGFPPDRNKKLGRFRLGIKLRET